MRFGRALAWCGAVWAVAAAVTAARAGETAPPLQLAIAVNDAYGKETACKCVLHVAFREYDEFVKRLRERHNVELVLTYFPEIYDLEKEFRAGHFAGAICKPWYLLRDPAGRRLVRVADLQDTAGQAALWGVVIVPKASPLRSLEDLAGRRLAMGQADSYEKNQAILRLLERRKVLVPPAQRVERASCLECLDLLLKGEVDAAAISNYALTADCAADVAKPEDFRILAETERIPLASLMVDGKQLDPAGVERLRAALLETSRAALPASMGGGFVAPAPWSPPELAGAAGPRP